MNPNVLIFFCDQLRVDLLGCYGGHMVRTPNIDELANSSVVFENAYTPISLCSPARASLMTGLYPHAHHMFNNSTPRYSYCQHLRPELIMIQDWIAENTNYETAYFGKWHIGPLSDLFKSRFHHTRKNYPDAPGYPGHPNLNKLGPLVRNVAEGKAGTVDIPMEGFPDVSVANLTRKFLSTRDKNRPFMAFCAFPGPHQPWIVPQEFGIRYDSKDIPMWPNRYDSFEDKPINQKKLRLLQCSKEAYISKYYTQDDDILRELLACCFSYIELIDDLVGKVIEKLKFLNLFDNTTVIFTADHGDMAGSHGFFTKGAYMYEETYHIPLIIKPAGYSGSKRTKTLVNLLDVTATILHTLAGNEKMALGQQELHGRSLIPLINGSEDWPRKVHYAQYHGDWYGHYSARMVTDAHWKLVWNLTDLCELYDLANDPGELKNLFYNKSFKNTRDRYFEQLIEEGKRLSDGHILMYVPKVEDTLSHSLVGPLSFE